MLYHFYETHKAEGKKSIHATYYLSGIAPQKWISSTDKYGDEKISKDSECQSFVDSDYEKDAYLVMLCKDEELEKMKKQFSRLYSVHIYGLSSCPFSTIDVLNTEAETPLRDDEGNAPVQ
jgi:hypothetical protein